MGNTLEFGFCCIMLGSWNRLLIRFDSIRNLAIGQFDLIRFVIFGLIPITRGDESFQL